MSSNPIDRASRRYPDSCTEQQWLSFLLELTDRLTVNSLPDVGKFALNYLIHTTGASFGDIKLIQGQGSDRHTTLVTNEVSAQSIATGGADHIAELQTAIAQDMAANDSLLWQAVETGKPAFSTDYASHTATATRFHPIEARHLGIFPIRTVNGNVIGTLTLACQDLQQLQQYPNYDMVTATCRMIGAITDRNRIEQESHQAEEKLSLTLDLTRIGSWDWCLKTHRLTWNENHYRLLGLVPGSVAPNYAFWRSLVHPEDQNRIEQAMAIALANHTQYEQEYRVIHPDGSVHWVISRGRGVYDATGQATQMIGIANDITRRKQAEEALRRSEEQYRALVKHFPQGAVSLFDPELRFTLVDGAILKDLGIASEVLSGKTLREVFPPDLVDVCEPHYQAAFAGHTNTFEIHYGDRLLQVTTLPVKNEQGDIFAGMSVYQDITQQKYLETLLQRTNDRLGNLVEKRTTELQGTVDQLHQEITRRRQTQAALAESDQRYRSVVAALQEGVILQDANGVIQACNTSAERILGIPADQLQGRTAFDPSWQMIHEDGSPFPGDTHPTMVSLRTGQPCQDVVMGFSLPEGGLRWITVNTQPLFHQGKSQPYAVVASFSDITERKHTQKQLQGALQRLNFHFENSPLGVIEWDADLRVNRWSRGAETIFGWTAAEVIGCQLNTDRPFIYSEDQASVLPILTSLRNGSEQRSFSFNRNHRQDGSVIYCEWYHSVLIDEDGNVVSILSLVMDVTERKLAEEELARQEERSRLFSEIALKIRQSLQLENILQTTVNEVRELLAADRVLIYHLAPDGTGTVLTDAVMQGIPSLTGCQFSPEVFPGESHKLYRQGRIRCVHDVETAGLTPCHSDFLHGLNVKAKLVVPLLQGTKLWGLMIAHQCNAPRQWSTFEVDLLRQLADQVNIALSQAQLLQALRDSEERFRQIAENIQEVFWMKDPNSANNSIVYVSPAYEEVWGRSCASLYEDHDSWLTTVHVADQERVSLALQGLTTGDYDEEYRILQPNGTIRWIRDRAFPIKDGSGNICRIAGIAEDITQRKQQEERLRLLESVVVNANDAVVITEAEPFVMPGPRIVYVNAAFERMTGYTSSEVIGKTPRILQGINTDRATLANIREALENWQSVVVELINYRKDRSEFWSEVSIMPVADQNGFYTHWVAIQRDVTRRKQLEAELLKTLEQEKELSELKSRFIAMTSHEFRTPLSTILSSSELLEYYGHLWTDEERLEQLRLIQTTVEHMTQLLEDILLIGRAEADRIEFNPTRVDLTQFCHELAAQIQVSIGKKHTIAFTSDCPLLMGSVDEKLLRQILTNLLSNAIKYSPLGSTIQFELAQVPNDHIVFRVTDQGIGIPPEDANRLFDTFHRARNVGTIPGTGLGLAIVKRCVEAQSGQIRFASTVGQGTTFEVTLPLQPAEE